MRKVICGLFVALAVVLAVAPHTGGGADQTETVANGRPGPL
ncbi:hypothetical protein [Streptomyces sp. S.PB5]|nr:hypothetical protein [Streptomyces sp. S.PB5]MDN3028420.1 hypothetical protein [Streptomyces sp. S.PB5]